MPTSRKLYHNILNTVKGKQQLSPPAANPHPSLRPIRGSAYGLGGYASLLAITLSLRTLRLSLKNKPRNAQNARKFVEPCRTCRSCRIRELILRLSVLATKSRRNRRRFEYYGSPIIRHKFHSWHGQPDSNRHNWIWSPVHSLYIMSVFGLGGGTRTCNRRINSAMHYHCATPNRWKSGRGSNPCTRFCRPRPSHSVTGLLKFTLSLSYHAHGAFR